MNFSKKTHKLVSKNEQIRKPKKNPQADVTRNGSIYFGVGLLLMLVVSYSTINYKTYEKSYIDIGLLDPGELDEEVIPLIKETPPPPIASPDIEIIDSICTKTQNPLFINRLLLKT